jgi:hypothetical protein
MRERADSEQPDHVEPVGILTREFKARLVNFSPTGCLVETTSRVEVGTIGSLRFELGGSEFVDDVQVVRCQQVEGAGSIYRVGARFLWTVAAGKGTLRRALEKPAGFTQFASFGV